MPVDEDSSSESEDEVLTFSPFANSHSDSLGCSKKSSIPQDPSNSLRQGNTSRSIHSLGWNYVIRQRYRKGAYSVLRLFFSFRAQKRVAQQRLDSRLDLGRIVDIRKKVFAEVKVVISTCPSWCID